MKTDIQLSTRFTQSQGAHQVGLLVSIGADKPPARAPINVALVLDRSGSMEGAPLHAAREAACRFAGYLGPQDRLSLVAFDDEVRTIFAGVPGGDPVVEPQIRRLEAGNSTNLSGGWLKGHELCQAARVEGVNRVVLFTDGQANVGIVEPAHVAGLVRGAATDGVGTSCFGFGPGFNEALLKATSEAGRGNFWYIETLDQMGPVFDEEIEGLVALVAQNLEIELLPRHPGVHGVTMTQDLPAARNSAGDGWRFSLGDLYATRPRELGIRFHVEHPESLGHVQLAEVRFQAAAIRPDGVERVVITLPVVANLDGHDHPQPTVDRTLLRFEVAAARASAVEQAAKGDFDGASKTLADAAHRLLPHATDPIVAEEVGDLGEAAQRMKQRQFDEADRHYHLARTRGVHEQKDAYLMKIKRPRT